MKALARLLARQYGRDPDSLEAGDLPQIDGNLPNGDPAHFSWREFTDKANEIIQLMENQ